MVILEDNIWVIWISRTFVKKNAGNDIRSIKSKKYGNFKLYRTLSKSVEISNYPDLLKSAETTTGQLKQKSAWNSNYTEFVKNARNCKLKGKQKSAGNLNYTEFCLKIRKIVYLK